jgi:hypothetical protein
MDVAPWTPTEPDLAGPDLHDPEVDPPAFRLTPRWDGRPDLAPYQRLVANPFLAAAALVGWFAATRAAIEAKSLKLFLLVAAAGLLIPLLLQFHCLDCGRTGHVVMSATHACPRVEERRRSGRPRWFRGPTPIAQTKIWLFVLAVLGGFALVLL